ncbi:MAG: Ig-like domain-containing protein [Clostridia bacterium]
MDRQKHWGALALCIILLATSFSVAMADGLKAYGYELGAFMRDDGKGFVLAVDARGGMAPYVFDVLVTRNGASVGMLRGTGAGKVEVPVPDLMTARYQITVTATDAAGMVANTSTLASLAIGADGGYSLITMGGGNPPPAPTPSPTPMLTPTPTDMPTPAPPPYVGPPTGVTLEGNEWAEIPLSIGKQGRLVATLLPVGATTSNLRWSSSKPKVARVDQRGIVTALRPGAAKITVKAGNKFKDSIRIYIVDPSKPTDIMLSVNDPIYLDIGETYQLSTTLLPDSATGIIQWSSSKPKVTTVVAGLVAAKKMGRSTITAKIGKIKASVPVIVLPND